MAVNSHMKIAEADGESVHVGNEKEIEVLAWSWGLSQPGTAHVAKGAGTGKVNIQDLSFTKYVDSASPKLIGFCCSGAHLATAILTISKAAGTEAMVYQKITLTDVIVSSVSTGGSGGGEDRLTENVTLNFGKFEYEYTPQKADQTAGTAIPTGWKIPENEKV